MGADKIPFGFRRDVEEKPEPEDERQQEISCTQLHEQKTWTPVVSVYATPNDGNNDIGRRWR